MLLNWNDVIIMTCNSWICQFGTNIHQKNTHTHTHTGDKLHAQNIVWVFNYHPYNVIP